MNDYKNELTKDGAPTQSAISNVKPWADLLWALGQERLGGSGSGRLKSTIKALREATSVEQLVRSPLTAPLLPLVLRPIDGSEDTELRLKQFAISLAYHRKFWRGLIYPVIVTAITGVVFFFSAIFMFPEYDRLYSEFGLRKPLPLELMFQTFPWLRLNWLPLIVFAIASLLLIRLWRSRGLTQRVLPSLAAGGRSDLRAIATFAQTLGELLQLGYSLQDSVQMSAGGCRRPALRMAAQKLANDLDAGRRPSESATSILPPLLFLGVRLEPASQAQYFRCLGQMYYERWLFAAQRSQTRLTQFAFLLFLTLVALAVFVMFLPIMMLLKALTGFGALLVGVINQTCLNSEGSVPYFATSLLGWLTTGKMRNWWRLNRIWKPNAKRQAQCSLLGMLELAYDPKMSQASQLTPGHWIELYAQEETGRHRRRTKLLAKRLQSGMPLADALEQTPDVLDDQSALAIRLAVQSGTLPATLRQLKTELQSDWLADQQRPHIAWRYYLGLLLALIGIFAFIRAWIVPMFAVISAEFPLRQTSSFRWMESGPLISLLLYLPGVLACMALSFWIAGRLGWIRWLSRALGSYISPRQRQLRRSRLIGLIASSMHAGRPAAGVLATLSRYHHDPKIRHQLLVGYREITNGKSLPESLAAAGIVNFQQSQALSALQSNSQQGWLLAQIADRMRGDVARVDRLLASIIHPVVICVYGLFVLWVCMGIFSMLARFIES